MVVRSWCDGSSDRSFMVIPLSYCRDADVVVLAGQCFEIFTFIYADIC